MPTLLCDKLADTLILHEVISNSMYKSFLSELKVCTTCCCEFDVLGGTTSVMIRIVCFGKKGKNAMHQNASLIKS